MSQLNLCPLRSSSKGNSTIIFDKTTKILVDCGISGKVLEACLNSAGLGVDSIDAILITHEHIDHIKGVGIVSRKFNIPVYANAATWQAMEHHLGKIDADKKKIFDAGSVLCINDIKIKSFYTSHDAAQSVGYVFEKDGSKVSIATDMGVVTQNVLDEIIGSKTALIEANYDNNMLEIGTYPYELKRRIKSSVGHLCNDEAASLAQVLVQNGAEQIFLGHLSEENNFPLLALKTVENSLFDNCACLGSLRRLSVVTGDGKIISSESINELKKAL